MNEQTETLGDTAKAVAVRTAVLSVGGLLIGGWIIGLVMKVAGKAIHLLLIVGVSLLGIGLAAFEVKQLEQKFSGDNAVEKS